jgi:hypothetical protein
MYMRKAISITLTEENLLWLRGQAAKSSKGSVSEVLDAVVREARVAGRIDPSTVRSVAGTIDLPEDDPGLEQADGHIRSIFATSAKRPMLVRERAPRVPARRKSARG